MSWGWHLETNNNTPISIPTPVNLMHVFGCSFILKKDFCTLIRIEKVAEFTNKTLTVIKWIYPSSQASSCWAHEVALGSLTGGCGQHRSAQLGKHSLNPALPVHTNICRLLTQWVNGPYPAPTVVIYHCISESKPHDMPFLCTPCFTAPPPAIPGTTRHQKRCTPFPAV